MPELRKQRLVFAGTPVFAKASLEALVDTGLEPVAVLTAPDRPAGRGRRLAASPVKDYATGRGMPLLQPASLREPGLLRQLQSLAPDAIVVAAYGLLFPPALLALPRAGCINVHASLLPRWRGAAPIQAAILAGDRKSGVCLMQMEAGLDTGPVFACRETPIAPGDTGGSLHDRLCRLGAGLLRDELPAILDGRLEPRPQDAAAATYAGKLDKEDARLDWREPAARLLRMLRAYDPAPGAWFDCAGERVRCLEADAAAGSGPPGTVLAAEGDGIDVATGDGAIRLLAVRRPGRGRVTGREFAAQHGLRDGMALPR